MHKFLGICFLIFFASSCAQILTPGGGPKDITPPKVLKYSPDSAATNFTGKKIILHFNEYVQVNDLQNQLVISPPMEDMPDVEIVKKDLVIKLKDSLLANTTYTISFGNAISDITEKNVLDNFRYVFSTGTIIDSLKVSGKILNASTRVPEKGIYIMLYTALGDSVPLKQKPYYFTKSKADGSFEFTNLRKGKYKLFALDDKNSNYKFDNSEERVAFSDQYIQLDANIDSINLNLFQEVPTKQKLIKGTEIGKGKFLFVYALPMHNPKISLQPALPSSSKLFSENSVNGDSISVWISDLKRDTLLFQIEDNRSIVDTVKIVLAKESSKQARGFSMKDDSRKMILNCNTIGPAFFDLQKPLVLSSSNPIVNFTAKEIILMKGKDTLKTDFSLSENKRYLTCSYKFDEDSSYSIFVKPGAITDCFAQKNDTLKSKFTIQKMDYYGLLTVKLTGLATGNYVLKLVNEKDAVVREMPITNETSVKFEMLPPGQYRLKLISDENKNGKWDTGNYLTHVQPEKAIYYLNPLKMRSGWDMDVEWKFQ